MAVSFPDGAAVEAAVEATTAEDAAAAAGRLDWDTMPALSGGGATTTASETMVLGVLLGMSVMCVACVASLCIASLVRRLRIRGKDKDPVNVGIVWKSRGEAKIPRGRGTFSGASRKRAGHRRSAPSRRHAVTVWPRRIDSPFSASRVAVPF